LNSSAARMMKESSKWQRKLNLLFKDLAAQLVF
jgi:hypothetical protein